MRAPIVAYVPPPPIWEGDFGFGGSRKAMSSMMKRPTETKEDIGVADKL